MSQATLEFSVNGLILKKSAQILRAINHPLRQRLLQFIRIYKTLKLDQSLASQHLSILRKAGFVSTQRDGQNIFYSVNYDRLEELKKFTKDC